MRLVLALGLACLAAAPAFAAGSAEEAAALKPVHAFIDGVNAGDMKQAAAAYAKDATIIDEFPPYRWQGAKAFAQWGADYGKATKAAAITDAKMTLETPRKVEVAGTHAYAVIPAALDFKAHGHPIHELGSFTFALTKKKAGWRIAAWSWAWRAQSK